jgi:intracellular sulfur oxidation DsrE/DsrF family protein
MRRTEKRWSHRIPSLLIAAAIFFSVGTAAAGEYAALKDVKGLDTVFDVSQGSPKMANVVFLAVRDVYQAAAVRALPNPPRTVVVFHGPAVKLISTDRSKFKPEDAAEVEQFAGKLRQMKKDGVTLEVCDYALKVMGIAPASVLPEINHVDNGFVSVSGYQAQGYSVIVIP